MEATPQRPTGKRPIEVGRIIDETFSTYRENAGPLIGSALVVILIASIAENLLGGILYGLLSTLIALIAGAIYTGFVVKLVEDVRDGRRDFSTRELISSASHYIGPLIVNSVLRALGIVVGLFFFIVPGLYLLTIWAVCAPAIVAEDRDAIGAFGRSSELVGNQKMAVFLTILVAYLTVFIVGLFGAVVGAAIAGIAGAIVLGTIVSVVTAPIAALVSAIVFYDLGGGAAPAADDRQVVVEY